MKKSLLILSLAAVAVSCKKVPEGGNKNVIEMVEGQEHYTDLERQGGSGETHGSHTAGSAAVSGIEINGTKMQAAAGGLEDRMAAYLKGGAYATATDENLKNTWYDFDRVSFQSGSATQLMPGSEVQLKNLATILKAHPEVKIKIGGYTDKTGNEEANKTLSQQRAEFLKNQLTAMGVGNQILGAEGYGSQFATAPVTAPDEAKAKDRRMAVRFAK